MAYIDEVKRAESEINKAFGITALKDYSLEEQESYTRIQAILNEKNITPEEYKRIIDEKMNEAIENMRLQDKFFQELVFDDPKAKEIQDRILQKEKEYSEQKAVFEAKKEAFEKNNQLYTELVNEHKIAEQRIAEKTKEMNDCLGASTEKAEQKEAKRIEELNKKLEEQKKKKEELAPKVTEATKLEKNTSQAIQAQKENGILDDELGPMIQIHEAAKKDLDAVLKEAAKIDKEIDKLSKQIEDKSAFEAEREKNNKRYFSAQEERMKLVDEEGKRELKILNAQGAHDQLERDYKLQASIYDGFATDYTFAREEGRQYAGQVAKRELDSHTKEFHTVTKYQDMQKQMSNTVPNKNSETIIKGAEALNRVYQSYKKNHNLVARALHFLPFLSSNKDYKMFDTLRDRFIDFSGVRVDDINKYLDTNGKEKLGALKTAFESPSKDVNMEKVDAKQKIEIPNHELEKNTNSKNAIEPVASTTEKVAEEDLSLYSNIADV